MSDAFLEVNHLKKYFNIPAGALHAVDDISFTLEKGKTIGIVGESGCGKSTMGRVIARLTSATDGEVLFKGENILNVKGRRLKKLRNDIQMIFQDPFSSLDPRKSIFNTIEEPLIIQRNYKDKADLREKVYTLMDSVGLARRLADSYPHELDGGRRQRIGIARALALEPELIICDEPVSALDVSIQAQILNMLKRLQQSNGYTYIFITHDLSVVRHFCQDVLVMYMGQLVEKAPVQELFSNPLHPYTKALLDAVPVPDIDNRRERSLIRGEITSPIDPPDACRFENRCEYAEDGCRAACPRVIDAGGGHLVRCIKFDQGGVLPR
ncbi:MAG: ABC transporter ATP-binding protein [Oscillospiraceae bacterium]|jgi:oligopeptide/dipeptide ABC transporter ATP-binding protein